MMLFRGAKYIGVVWALPSSSAFGNDKNKILKLIFSTTTKVINEAIKNVLHKYLNITN